MVLQRSRVVRVLVAIALVALAAVGLRLSEGEEDQFEVVRGVVDTPVAINGGTVTASTVRVGTSLARRGDLTARTPGIFVVVRIEVAATGTERVRGANLSVLTRDRRYDSFDDSSTGQVEPGFAAATDAIFEVDPTDLADLTVELNPTELVSGYTQHARIHLGITGGNAEQWRAAAVDQVIEPLDRSTRAL